MNCRRENGAALVTVISVAGLLLAISTALAIQVMNDTKIQNAHEQTSRSFYAAEGGLNRGMAEFGNIFRDYRVPVSGDFAPRTTSFGDETVRYQLLAPLPPLPANPTLETIPAGAQFAGLNSILYRYTVRSSALGEAGSARNTLDGQFLVHNIPLFQFLAFYQGDLEVIPGPTMRLHGRIHTNGDLYLSAYNSLYVEDNPPEDITTVQISATGRAFRGELFNGQCRDAGQVWISRLADEDANGRLDPREIDCAGNSRREITAAEAADWLGAIQLGIQNIEVPGPDLIDRGTGLFWQKADLRIVLDARPGATDHLTDHPLRQGPDLRPIEIQDAAGNRDDARTALLHEFMIERPGKVFYNDVPNVANADTDCDEACAANPANYSPAFGGATPRADMVYRRADDAGLDPLWRTDTGLPLSIQWDYRRGGFYNNRETGGRPNPSGKWMLLLNVDLQALLDWNRAQPVGQRLFDPADATEGGVVVFASVVGPASAGVNNYGVRFFDSANLGFTPPAPGEDPTGVTVVSDQAIYVSGNYNSVNWTPAAVIGDSLNVLSQGWEDALNDRKSRRTVPNRVAAPTTVNAAFLGGVDVTIPGTSYNGGLANYPRFHEHWTGQSLRYRGSFVSLGPPSHVNGPWCETNLANPLCNIFNPPVRDWDYDPRFNDVANLPPLTPRFVFVRQVFFSQEFR